MTGIAFRGWIDPAVNDDPMDHQRGVLTLDDVGESGTVFIGVYKYGEGHSVELDAATALSLARAINAHFGVHPLTGSPVRVVCNNGSIWGDGIERTKLERDPTEP